MRYFEEKGNKFIQNGASKVRVGEIIQMKSPIFRDRVVRVFEVLELFEPISKANPIQRGHHLCLSFPSEKMKCKEYVWYKDGKFEECQIPMTLNDGGPVNRVISS